MNWLPCNHSETLPQRQSSSRIEGSLVRVSVWLEVKRNCENQLKVLQSGKRTEKEVRNGYDVVNCELVAL